MPFSNYIYEYYDGISSGNITVGKWVRLLYEYIVRGLQEGLFTFNAKKANKAIRFIENFCHHCEGRTDLLKLELWQKAAVSVMFGIVEEDGTRVFREVFIVIGRKNGKTLFASAVIAYMAYLDGEYGAKIYCLAPKLEQANIVYDNFYQMIKKEPELSDLSKKRRSDIYIEESNTAIKPLAFNAKRSTAFLKGGSKERRLLPLLYMIDDVEKWNDLEELKKANPNMGVSVSPDFFKEEIAVAEMSMSKRAEFLTKYCNIKQNSSVAWLDYVVVDGAGIHAKLEDFKDSYAVGGIDLSQTTDLTAASVVIERDGVLYAFAQFFMPANRLETAQAIDGVPYDIFVKQGIVKLSGENHVDYRDVYEWFSMLRDQYGIYILKIGYDRYSAQYLIDDLKNAGWQTDDVWQGENLAPVIREFEGVIKDGNFKIADNNLLKAHFLNVALKHNMETRKFRPVKIEQRARIDGFVSVIDALTVRQKYYNEIGEMLKNAG